MKRFCYIFFIFISTQLFANDFISNYVSEADLLKHYVNGKFTSSDYLDDIYEYDVLHYEIHIDVTDTVDASVNGVVYLSAIIENNGFDTIIFDLKEALVVDSLHIENETTGFSYTFAEGEYYPENDRVFAPLPQNFSKDDQFKLRIKYHGIPPEGSYFNASYKVQSHLGATVVSTMSSPQASRYWRPCKDIPKDKALVDMYITCWEHQTAVSNGLLQEELPAKDGKKVFHWKTEYPVATYITSLTVSNYKHHQVSYTSSNGETFNIDYYVYPEKEVEALHDFSKIPDMMNCYEQYYGEYPFTNEKYGMVMFPWSGGMENQTITSFGSGLINGAGGNEGIMAHELAHHWYGDMVTPATWNDVWLKEGAAVFSEAVWALYAYGEETYIETMNEAYNQAISIKEPLYGYEPTFSRFVYDKGAWIFHMLRSKLGDELFYDTMSAYAYEAFPYGACTTEEFFEFFQSYSDVNLERFKQDWIYGGGYPEYAFEYHIVNDTESSQVTIKVTQEQDTSGSVGLFEAKIPVVIQFADFTSTQIELTDSLEYQEFTFDFPKRVVNMLTEYNFNYKDKILCKKRVIEEKSTYKDLVLEEKTFALLGNYPNPFNPETKINFITPIDGDVKLRVFDVSGKTVLNEKHEFKKGKNFIKFDGTNLSSGLYYYKVITENGDFKAGKMILLK